MNDRRVWFAFMGLALAWGTSFLFIKIGVQTLPPVTLVAFRLLIGLAGLLVVMRLQKLAFPRERKTWAHLFVLGAVHVGLPFALITWAESGEQGINSGLASVLNSIVPLFSVVISGLLLRAEPVTGGRILGLLVGFAGVVLLVGPDLDSGIEQLTPYAAMIVAALCYAAATAYARHYLSGLRPVVLSAGQLVAAVAVVFPIAILLEDAGPAAFTPAAIGSLLWLGLIGSCLAYILYFFILSHWGATRATLVTYVVPVVGVTAGALILGETVGWQLIVGGLMILSGVATVNWKRRSARPLQQAAEATPDA